MRSFHLLLLMFSLLSVSLAVSANSMTIPQAFFKVTLPYDSSSEALPTKGKVNTPSVVRMNLEAQEGMRILLLRLTGQTRLIESKLGQEYIAKADKWLASYHFRPRQEDGVTVGQNIEFNFDAERLKASFAQNNIKLWAQSQRPSTLVMGAFIQQGRLEKLNTEILNYRVDVDFRDYPVKLGLPVLIPEENKNWVFPVDPANGYNKIQEILLSANQSYLLSFKLLAQSKGQFELTWYLFNTSGQTIKQAVFQGENRQALMQKMFETVMQQYVKLVAVKNIRKNHVFVNINGLKYGDQVNQLEQDLKEQQPLIRSAVLVEVSPGSAQFDIEYQGELTTFLDWLQNWNKIQFLTLSADKQTVDAKAVDNRFVPQIQHNSEANNQSES